MHTAPQPTFPCYVSIKNATELPLTAVCVKWALAHNLAPGHTSRWASCPTETGIEFQFAEPGTPYEEIEWAHEELGLRRGRRYLITVAGTASEPRFEVEEVSPCA